MKIIGETFNELYRDALNAVYHMGDRVSPRGLQTRELRATTLMLQDPTKNILVSPSRGLNYSFMVAEWLWHATGQTGAEIIGHFNPHITEWANDQGTFDGAYGPKIVDQLPYVIQTLRDDPSSRQALLTIWRERPGKSKDIPCTVLFQYMIRNGRLEAVTYMRSNDVWFGLPYDVFNFTQLQRQVAATLDVPPGPYHHVAGSLHMYEEGPSAAAAERWEDVYEDLWFDAVAPCPGPWPVPPEVQRAVLEIATGGMTDETMEEIRDRRPAWMCYLSTMETRNTPALIPNEPFGRVLREFRDHSDEEAA